MPVVMKTVMMNMMMVMVMMMSFFVTGSMMKDSFIVCWQGFRKSSKKVPGAKGFFDTARQAYGGTFSDSTVDGVISVVRLLPIFFFVIMYWAIYSQVMANTLLGKSPFIYSSAFSKFQMHIK